MGYIHGCAVAELLPHKARDLGSILTTGIVCMKFVHSPCERMGFPRVLRYPSTLPRSYNLKIGFGKDCKVFLVCVGYC